tara:strand:- start:10801 stop:11136 length:336 start_codon:yes stop_codon:yes gene_type:complete
MKTEIKHLNMDDTISGNNDGLAPGMHLEVDVGQIYTVQRVCLDDDQCRAAAKYGVIHLLDSVENTFTQALNGVHQNWKFDDPEEDKAFIETHVKALRLVASYWYGYKGKNT